MAFKKRFAVKSARVYRKKKRFPTRRFTRSTRRAVARIARRAVNAEVKYATATICDDIFTADIARGSLVTPTDVMPCLPAIPEGDDPNQRHGRKVNGRYLYIKGTVCYDKNTIATYGAAGGQKICLHPLEARIIIAQQKNVKNCAGMNPTGAASTVNTDVLLAPYDGTTLTKPYTGSREDNMYPINKDVFHVYMDKKIRLKPQIMGSYTDSTVVTMGQVPVHFMCKIKCPKTLYFDPDIDPNSRPVNFAPFMVAGWAWTNGVNPSTGVAAEQPIRITATTTLYYTDP